MDSVERRPAVNMHRERPGQLFVVDACRCGDQVASHSQRNQPTAGEVSTECGGSFRGGGVEENPATVGGGGEGGDASVRRIGGGDRRGAAGAGGGSGRAPGERGLM
jgi:hypothetical protein